MKNGTPLMRCILAFMSYAAISCLKASEVSTRPASSLLRPSTLPTTFRSCSCLERSLPSTKYDLLHQVICLCFVCSVAPFHQPVTVCGVNDTTAHVEFDSDFRPSGAEGVVGVCKPSPCLLAVLLQDVLTQVLSLWRHVGVKKEWLPPKIHFCARVLYGLFQMSLTDVAPRSDDVAHQGNCHTSRHL